MLVEKRNEKNNLIVMLLEERLDAKAALDFKNMIVKEIDEGANNLVIDLEQVDFIDSSGLGALVSILKILSKEGRLSITGLTQKTEQIFRLTRMDTIFNIYPSVTEALEAA